MIKSGKSSPSSETFERLAEYFGVSIDFFGVDNL
ncbi:helix-turn-helix domain-containing protein [Lactococcus lactis]|nr:helix-turn-helix transcriptional regulator [Lactococcus lactis]